MLSLIGMRKVRKLEGCMWCLEEAAQRAVLLLKSEANP